jgi:hypothetical protein
VSRWLSLVVLALAACGGREVKIEVAIPGPDSVDAPVAHLGLVALPYDRDSLLSALEARHPRPVALTRPMDSLFQIFRAPFVVYAAAAFRLGAVERALEYRKAALDSLPRSSPAYDSLYRAFAAASDSFTIFRQRRDAAQHTLAEYRNRVTPALDSLRTLMSQWEDSTYRGYDSLTKALGTGLGREPIADSTDALGKATLRLPSGNWWIYARSWDTWDPNSEWYWNVPVRGERLVLDRASGRRVPRY